MHQHCMGCFQIERKTCSSFSLTSNGSQALDVNTGRILPGFGRELRIIENLDCLVLLFIEAKMKEFNIFHRKSIQF